MGLEKTIAVNRSNLDRLIAKLGAWQDELDDLQDSDYWRDVKRRTRLRCQIRAARDNLRLAAICESQAAGLGWVDDQQDAVEEKLERVTR